MINISANKLILWCILFFPISTILQGIQLFNAINKILIAVIICLLLMSFFIDKITVKILFILILTVPSTYLAIAYLEEKIYNFNMMLYLPLWIIFFLYMQTNYISLMNLVVENIFLIKIDLFCWNALVFISMFIPSCYIHDWGDVYFKSFSSAEHRFASSCLFAFSLFWVLELLTHKLIYYIYGAIPLVGILLCGARTYLAVAAIYCVCIYYLLCKNKKVFYLSVLPLMALGALVILLSPIGSKLTTLFKGDGYWGYWGTLTSGRSVFWVIDMNAFSKLNLWHKFVGNGLNYVYNVNRLAGHGNIWAHNDVINILLSNGYLGVYLYLAVFLRFTGPLLKKKYKIPKMMVWGFYTIWFFNASFNMVYTYTCAVLAMPFILYSLCHLPQQQDLEGRLINRVS